MSYPAQRIAAGTGLRGRLAAAELVPTVLLCGVGVGLARRWWAGAQETSLPLTRGVLDLPLVGHLYQLPGMIVVGLLFLRAVALPGDRTATSQRLSVVAGRWSWVWAAATVAWLALTASKLTGVSVAALGTRTDLPAVLGRSDQATTHVTTLWVALVIALFGHRLTSTWEIRALVVLAAAALLPVLTETPGPGHGAGTQHAGLDLHWLAVAALATQALVLTLWCGGLVSLVVHLRAPSIDLVQVLPRWNLVATVATLTIGVAALVQETLALPSLAALTTSTAGQLVGAKAVALVLLVTVGCRHRQRSVETGSGRRLLIGLRLVAGELVLLGAVAVAVLAGPTA